MIGVSGAHGGFLARLSPGDQVALLGVGHARGYRQGAVVFREGDRAGYALLITTGRVKVLTATADGVETVLSLRGPGDLVGELAVIDDEATPRSATVIALEPLRCRVLPRTEFLTFLGTHARVTVELLRMLAARLRDSDRRRVEHGAYSSSRRLAALLVELADTYGRPAEQGIRVDAMLSQVELAGLIGASRESVARALAALRWKGFVATGRRSLLIRDVEALRSYAR